MIYTKISLTELVNGLVNATHILRCARVHDCIGYHRLSVNENLRLIDGVEKVVGWNPLRWNRQSPVLYPSYNPPTLSFIIMLEDGSMFGD